MSNNQENHIEGREQLREAIREIVSKRVYDMVKESMYEQYFENDEKSEESSNQEDTKQKDNKDVTSQELSKKRNQVTTLLRDPKINMAELGRDLYPDMSDDASRSLISKKSRGVRELTPDEIITLYQKLKGTKVSS